MGKKCHNTQNVASDSQNKGRDVLWARKKERVSKAEECADKATRLNVRLVLSGYAMIWAFKETSDVEGYKGLLFFSIALFSASLFLLLIKYVITAIVVDIYSKGKLFSKKNDKIKKTLPQSLYTTVKVLWGLQFVLSIIAYIIIAYCFVKLFL